ncbi:MAG: SMP-30/gluconolactonase/LRE family protein [Caulobacteraceae bacterium]
MKTVLPLAFALALAPLQPVWSQEPAPAAAIPPPCLPSGGVRYVCNVQVVEDMMVVPGGRWVAGSAMAAGAGGLYLIDTRTLTAHPAKIVMGKAQAPFDRCPGPPDMKTLRTHGIDLKPGKGPTATIYAVAHGGRESIEVFKIDASTREPKVTWTGCVVLPKNASGNAVAALPNGRIAVTKFMNADDNDGIVHIMSGQITGTVYVWTPRKGFSEAPGARLSGDNGLLVSKDGHSLYVNDFGNKAVYRIPLDRSGEITHVKTDFRPDNLRWAPDGKIIATGQFVDLNNRNDLHGWAAVKIDPETLKAEPYVKVPGSAAFDNGTTALPVGKDLYIGTYRGDRVAVIPAP